MEGREVRSNMNYHGDDDDDDDEKCLLAEEAPAYRKKFTLPFLRYVNAFLALIFIDGIQAVVLWLTG